MVLTAVSAAKPRPELTYEMRDAPTRDWKAITDPELMNRVKGYLRIREIARVDRLVDAGQREPVWSSDAGLTGPISRAEQIALHLDLESGVRGGEADILAGNVPVTVYWDKPHELSFVAGPLFERSSRVSSFSELREKYGVRYFEEIDAAWTPQTLALIRDLHELGHAIDDARMRELATATYALEGDVEQLRGTLNAMILAFNAGTSARLEPLEASIQELSARLTDSQKQLKAMNARLQARAKASTRTSAGFAKGLPPARAPTTYGRKDADECFADCYGLFKVDPAALKRASPGAHAWFLRGEHLRLATLPLD